MTATQLGRERQQECSKQGRSRMPRYRFPLLQDFVSGGQQAVACKTLPAFANLELLEHSHVHSFANCLCSWGQRRKYVLAELL